MKLALLALLFSATVQAQVLRCDTGTSVLYTNMGCVGGVGVDASPKINSFPPAPYVIPMYEHRGPSRGHHQCPGAHDPKPNSSG